MAGPAAFLRDYLRAWLEVPDRHTVPTNELEEATDTDNVKAIAELAYRRYSEEHARTKDIESKATPVISLLSATILFAAGGGLNAGGRCLTGRNSQIFSALLVIAIGVFFFALLNMLLVLWIQVFKYIDLREWALEKYTRRSAEELRSTYEDIAGSYRKYTDVNIAISDRKGERYSRGLGFLFLGVVIILGDFMWAGCGIPRFW